MCVLNIKIYVSYIKLSWTTSCPHGQGEIVLKVCRTETQGTPFMEEVVVITWQEDGENGAMGDFLNVCYR